MVFVYQRTDSAFETAHLSEIKELDKIVWIDILQPNEEEINQTVASVVLMPPTLVASIYGMNFHFMPELDWHIGYPFSLGLMVITGIIPLVYFRKKKWL
jgi:magnesium transporter